MKRLLVVISLLSLLIRELVKAALDISLFLPLQIQKWTKKILK